MPHDEALATQDKLLSVPTIACNLPAELCLRIVGLTEGEGCFFIGGPHRMGNYNPGFVIHLRADDCALLERLHAETGLGRIAYVNRGSKNPAVRWEIVRKADVIVLRALFERYPLWSKKRRDFEIWSRAVDFWTTSVEIGGYSRADWDVMARLKAELSAVRRYKDPLPE